MARKPKPARPPRPPKGQAKPAVWTSFDDEDGDDEAEADQTIEFMRRSSSADAVMPRSTGKKAPRDK